MALNNWKPNRIGLNVPMVFIQNNNCNSDFRVNYLVFFICSMNYTYFFPPSLQLKYYVHIIAILFHSMTIVLLPSPGSSAYLIISVTRVKVTPPTLHRHTSLHLVQTASCNWSGGAVVCVRVQYSVLPMFSVCGWRLSRLLVLHLPHSVSAGGAAACLCPAKDETHFPVIRSPVVPFQPRSLEGQVYMQHKPWHTQKPALLLFIYLSALPLSLHPSHPLQDGLHYSCLHSFRDVNKSDSGGCWNDSISLSAGSLVTLPPLTSLATPPPHHLSCAAAAT